MTIKSVINPSVVGDNLMEICPPRARCDASDKLVLDKNGLPQFDHDIPRHFWSERNVPIKPRYFERHLQSTPRAYIAVFIALANTCEYSKIRIRVDEEHKIVTNGSGDAIAEIIRHGNRTKTRSYEQIAKEAGVHVDTVRKAIGHWIITGIIKEIPVDIPTAKRISRKKGRPIKVVRFEIDPEYVWLGNVVESVSYILSKRYNRL